ncbi:interleukin-17 receptor E-like [Pristis pectinata]|uniref:interleukin-17 receptor E-like n=1 Tax=Pristis pectinata TaxID=685728 RepID=UPI00223DE56C|nr:interleukin-17 receptor E-like [Pristis pectinata]
MDSFSRHLFSLFLINTVLSGGSCDVRRITELSAFGDPGGKQEQLDIENCTYWDQVKAPDGYNLNLSRLLISTVLFCPSSPCTSCVRVAIKINNTVPVKIEGVQIHFFEYKSNRNNEIQIRWKNHMQPINAADFVFECFESDGGSQVEVAVKTIPDYGPQLTANYIVEDYEKGPRISYSVIPEQKQIIVTAPPGHMVKAMLCYKRGLLCRELSKHSIQLINTTSTLSYDYLLPCLCIQAFYPGHDSHRTTDCPFTDAPEAFGPDLWRSSNFSDLIQHKNNMAVRYNGKCLIKPHVVLCWKSNGSCVEFEVSATKFLKSGYVFESVDKHSQMCFKFKYKNSSHIECRNRPDTDWNVTMEVESNKLMLTFVSHFPASFSAVLCKSVGDDCKNTSLIYCISQTELSSQKLLMILPVESPEFCVRVWRSDVNFSGKQLLCPHYSRQWMGLGLLGMLIVLVIVLLVIYVVWQFTTKVVSAPLWSRTVLLMYSPDSEEHKTLICAFADILKTELDCNVILDLWDSGSVAEIGIVSWLYSKRELVETEGGKIIIIWSRKSQEMYKEWYMLEPVSGLDHDDLHDLFSTSMACIYNDILRNRRIKDYSIIYFNGLCSKENIPEIFAKIPKYQMLKDFSSLVSELQSLVDLPCRLKLSTKYLVCKILKSEKMQRLKRKIEQSRKLQEQRHLCSKDQGCSD